MEVYYKAYDPPTVERLREAAERSSLIPLGGSDYHGLYGEDEPFPGQRHTSLPDASIEEVLRLGRERAEQKSR